MQRRELASALIASSTAAVLLSEKSQAQTCTTPCYAQTSQESAAGITPSNYAYSPSPVYNMARYGITPNGVDNTAIVQSVFNMIKTTGGTMVFPHGDWAFYLDVSGTSGSVVIEGNGSTFRCFTATPTQSCVIFANNSGAAVTSAGTPITADGYGGAAVQIRNCNIVARLYSGGSVTGDLNCAVAIYGTAIKTWNVDFIYGKIAAFFGYYCQYSEFWSSAFFDSNLSATSAGCILTGYGNNSGSNEVEFIRCEFQSNAVGLHIKGAFKTRLYGCNMQGNGTAYPVGTGTAAAGVLILNADASGFGCVNPTIEGVWFEDNYAPDIYEATATNSPRILNCAFYGGGTGTRYITSSFCFDWVIQNCQVYGVPLICTLNWPAADTGTAKLTFRGNNFPPVLNLVHAGGGYDMDLHSVGSFTGTLTGCTSSPNTTVWYAYEGTCIDLKLPNLTATSDGDSCTLTGLPTAIAPLTEQYGSCLLENGSAAASGNCSVSGETVTFYAGGSATGFSASGTKGVIGGVFRYPLFT